jgi:hypothetical protein
LYFGIAKVVSRTGTFFATTPTGRDAVEKEDEEVSLQTLSFVKPILTITDLSFRFALVNRWERMVVHERFFVHAMSPFCTINCTIFPIDDLAVIKEFADVSLVEGVVDGFQMDFNVNVQYLHQRAREVLRDVIDFAKDWQETPVFFIQFLSIGIGNPFRHYQTTSRRR